MVNFLNQGRCCPGQGVIMLECFFEARFTLNRLRSGPSGPFIDSFARRLKTVGYSWWTARVFLRAAGHLGRYAETQQGGFGEVDWSTLEAFRRQTSGCTEPAIAPRFQVGRHLRGVGDPDPSPPVIRSRRDN